jgi:hypothetical protein
MNYQHSDCPNVIAGTVKADNLFCVFLHSCIRMIDFKTGTVHTGSSWCHQVNEKEIGCGYYSDNNCETPMTDGNGDQFSRNSKIDVCQDGSALRQIGGGKPATFEAGPQSIFWSTTLADPRTYTNHSSDAVAFEAACTATPSTEAPTIAQQMDINGLERGSLQPGAACVSTLRNYGVQDSTLCT